eukprot:TRINITY_DN25512_c0_g1_i1.p1 TRINITY_DN25512_c0_g1~~TRINITY_DN25512_c0_g1_i1.p1  ORF type:complete len:439 (-),score=56.66 TRINITY_DN25512_c0_g1_i1:163-1410(-)
MAAATERDTPNDALRDLAKVADKDEGVAHRGVSILRRATAFAIWVWTAICVLDGSGVWWSDADSDEQVESLAIAASILGFSLVFACTGFCILPRLRRKRCSSCGSSAADAASADRLWAGVVQAVLMLGSAVWLSAHAVNSRDTQLLVGVGALAVLLLVAAYCILVEVLYRRRAPTPHDADDVQLLTPSGLPVTLKEDVGRLSGSESRASKISFAADHETDTFPDTLDDTGLSWEARKLREMNRKTHQRVSLRASAHNVSCTPTPLMVSGPVLELPSRPSRWKPLFEDPTFGGSVPPLEKLKEGYELASSLPDDLPAGTSSRPLEAGWGFGAAKVPSPQNRQLQSVLGPDSEKADPSGEESCNTADMSTKSENSAFSDITENGKAAGDTNGESSKNSENGCEDDDSSEDGFSDVTE